MAGELTVVNFVFPELESNGYLVSDGSGSAIMFDPGGDPRRVVIHLERTGWKLAAIINTHGHADHVQGNAALRQATGAPISIHESEATWLENPLLNGALWLGWDYTPHRPDSTFADGDTVGAGEMQFRVVLTPGHTPGSCCLIHDESKLIIGGDLVFAGSVGRTDLPGGNQRDMEESLRRFATFPRDYTVLPGHGPETTVGREVETNPFILEALAARR